MINNPKVMIVDEPLPGLDAMTRELMRRGAMLDAYQEVDLDQGAASAAA